MYINKIEIKNFRNYEKQEIELNPHINIFYGDNAQGKTNRSKWCKNKKAK